MVEAKDENYHHEVMHTHKPDIHRKRKNQILSIEKQPSEKDEQERNKRSVEQPENSPKGCQGHIFI